MSVSMAARTHALRVLLSILALAGAAVLVGCPGSGLKPRPDGASDTGAYDRGAPERMLDAASDAPVADLGGRDRGIDGLAELGVDATVDHAPDIPRDAAVERAFDAGPPGALCSAAEYSGFRCLSLVHQSSRFPQPFQLTLRWNVHHTAPKATVLWVLGNQGEGGARRDTAAAGVQDRLAATDAIRSLEISFENDGGYFSATPRGYIDAGFVYTEVVNRLLAMGLIEGAWTVHVGHGNGSMVAAAALAHHGLATIVGRLIFVSGPFLSDMARECSESTYFGYIGSASIRQVLDQWNGWTTQQTCELSKTVANPPYATRSLLGSSAQLDYTGVSINVLIGDRDSYGPWILRSNEIWYEAIGAGDKTRHVLAGVGHLALGGPGASAQPSQALWDTLYGYARLPALTPLYPKPALVFSATRDGPAQHVFGVDDTVYGRTENIGISAQGCLESLGSRGMCDDLANFVTMPDADWSYDATARKWRTAFVPSSIGLTAGDYRAFWRDTTSEQHTDLVEVQLTP